MGGSGNVIFVGLGTKSDGVTTKILLSQSADGSFEVLDKNGTDGEASFTNSTTLVATLLCSTDNEVFVRGTGKSRLRNVTSALTTITLAAGSPAELACGTCKTFSGSTTTTG